MRLLKIKKLEIHIYKELVDKPNYKEYKFNFIIGLCIIDTYFYITLFGYTIEFDLN